MQMTWKTKTKKIDELRHDRELKVKDKERIFKNLNDERREKLEKIAEVNKAKIDYKDLEEKVKDLERKLKEKDQELETCRTELGITEDKFHAQLEQSALFQKECMERDNK